MLCLIYKERNENLNFIPTWLFPSNFKQITQENWDEISCWNSNLHFQRSIKENLCFFRRSSFWVMDRRVLEIFFFWMANRGCNWSKTLTVAVILVQVWISTSVHEMFTSDRVQIWVGRKLEGNWMPAQALSLHCWALWGRLDCLPQADDKKGALANLEETSKIRINFRNCKKKHKHSDIFERAAQADDKKGCTGQWFANNFDIFKGCTTC